MTTAEEFQKSPKFCYSLLLTYASRIKNGKFFPSLTINTLQPQRKFMFGFKSSKPQENDVNPTQVASDEASSSEPPKTSWFGRLKQGLSRTREILNTDVMDLIHTRQAIDDEVLEELETLLLTADVGVEATQNIINDLTERVKKDKLKDTDDLFNALSEDMQAMLQPVEQELCFPASDKPFVILVVGVNGAGKTTTIGKLAKKFQADGQSVMLAAGDTFRAAAVEQLQTWGQRNNVPVVAQHTNADSAAVVFDALQSATAKNIDVLIADTAGRLHTKDNLMEELRKVKRVMSKIDPDAPQEVLLVLDATTGQNALNQAAQFSKAVTVTGLTITKLDGTAKGGIVFAMAQKLGIPIRFIGVGEGVDDLRPFVAQDFVNALLSREGGE